MSPYMDYLARNVGYKSYNSYLVSDYWKLFTKANKKSKCYVCKHNRNLQVHHLTYERLGDELPQDVITVCGDCHEKIHKLVKEGEKLETAHTKIPKPIVITTTNKNKWVYWKQLCNKSLKQSPKDVVTILRNLEYIESNSVNPTNKAIACNLAKITDDKIQWNLPKYISIARFYRKASRRLS